MEYFVLEFFTHTFYIFFFCVYKNISCSYAAPSRLSARCRSFAKYRFSCKQFYAPDRKILSGIAAVAKVSCKHGLWLVARVKKEYRLLGTQKNHIY